MCQALKFPRSTYYEALLSKPSLKKKAYQEFSNQVLECYQESKGRYGAIKLHKVLNSNGIPCSVKRVQRHMKRLSIRSVVVKNTIIKRIMDRFLMIKTIS